MSRPRQRQQLGKENGLIRLDTRRTSTKHLCDSVRNPPGSNSPPVREHSVEMTANRPLRGEGFGELSTEGERASEDLRLCHQGHTNGKVIRVTVLFEAHA